MTDSLQFMDSVHGHRMKKDSRVNQLIGQSKHAFVALDDANHLNTGFSGSI